MKLTKGDKDLLLSWGYDAGDLQQIEEATQSSKTKYWANRVSISREKAIEILGRTEYLSGISRSAFHATAARETDDGKTVVLFDSSRLLNKGKSV